MVFSTIGLSRVSATQIPLVHCSQHLLTVKSEWLRWRAPQRIDYPVPMIPMILTLSNSDSYSYCLTRRRSWISSDVAQPVWWCDPRLVTEWVRIPIKTWLYLLRERSQSFACNGFPSRMERSTPFLLYGGIIICNKCVYSSVVLGGRTSLVVKITDSLPACHKFKPITAEDPPCGRG
ncbi:hypothetical protein TNCV_549391 [Trichonephila clavipes]|nr:hypothetical protein TNCV_549391 [Trichonephila clavipes]